MLGSINLISGGDHVSLERLDLAELKEFFLEGAIKRAVDGATKVSTIAGLPRSRLFRYKRGKYFYADWHFSPEGGKIGGQTGLWCCREPVWLMQYDGWWQHKDKDGKGPQFLAEALTEAYWKKEFWGGRGPKVFKKDTFVYHNLVGGNDFSRFDGMEFIVDVRLLAEKRERIYTLEYSGLLLV